MNGASRAFALLTDFGLADPYVGQLKAVLFSHAPSVPILDISHDVPPFSLPTGAFFLAVSRPYYPAGTIFICIVDPGVGSSRNLLCISGQKHILMGPDNGLLSLACRDMQQEGTVTIHTISSSPTNRVTGISPNTFHGRDILAPVASSLANGTPITALADMHITEIAMPAWSEATRSPDGIICSVLHVDRFGNCILNLPNSNAQWLPSRLCLHLPLSGEAPELQCASHYAALPPGILGIIPGGQGYYELALANDSAAKRLGLASGDVCHVRNGQ